MTSKTSSTHHPTARSGTTFPASPRAEVGILLHQGPALLQRVGAPVAQSHGTAHPVPKASLSGLEARIRKVAREISDELRAVP